MCIRQTFRESSIRAWLLLGLVGLVLSACSDDSGLIEDDNTPPNGDDTGIVTDLGGTDQGTQVDMSTRIDMGDDEEDLGQNDDEDMADSGSDAGTECDNVCGDVNGDGTVDVMDIQELGLIVNGDRVATPCELEAGDLLADGGIDQDDLELLGLIVAGTIDGACEACVGECGDLDGNGEISILDVPEVLELTEGEAPTACQFVQADVLKDWEITEADAEAVGNMVFDATDGACMPCELQCGDVDGDGQVGLADVNRLSAHVDGDQRLDSVCALWASNVNGDSQVNNDDVDRIFDLVSAAEDPSELNCRD